MSVESQSGELKGADMLVTKQKPSNIHTKPSEDSEMMERLPSSTSTPHVPIIADFTESESSPTERNEVRDWMMNMGCRERTHALAFVDKSFWTALLSFTSWSKASSTSSSEGTSKYCSA